MDWKYKHFHQEALFASAPATVLEAARTVMTGSLPQSESAPAGFVARGESAWHAATATVHAEPTVQGTMLVVDLLVERATWRGFMLVDIGGYYDGQMHKWLSAIAQGLGQPLISISKPPLRQSCLLGCAVYLVLGTVLVLLSIPLDHLFFSQASEAGLGPLGFLAAIVGLLAGVAAFLYKSYPDAPIWSSFRKQIGR